MKKIIVYHDTEAQAFRSRRPREGETISYRTKDQFDAEINATYDEVIDFSTKTPNPKTTVKKGKGHDV